MPAHVGAHVYLCAAMWHRMREQMCVRTHMATHMTPYDYPTQEQAILSIGDCNIRVPPADHSPTLRGCTHPQRHQGDSNPCGQSPMDFESISLTTRTQCHNRQRNPHVHNDTIVPLPRHHGITRSASAMRGTIRANGMGAGRGGASHGGLVHAGSSHARTNS